MKRTRLNRCARVAGVTATALLLSCCLLAGCGQEETTTTDALDTMENQAGDVSISLGMDQAAVEKNLGTGTQLDATEDPQMETISYGEGADYLVVIYQEGKVFSLGTYWEDLEDLNAGTDTSTPDQDSKWKTTEGIARGAALEDLQKAYPDGKYRAKNTSPEDGSQPSQNLFQTKGTTGGLTFVLTDEGVVKTINLITLDYFANDVGLQ